MKPTLLRTDDSVEIVGASGWIEVAGAPCYGNAVNAIRTDIRVVHRYGDTSGRVILKPCPYQ